MVMRVKPTTREEAERLVETHAIMARADDLAVLSLGGKDRLSWLGGLVTQDVGKLGPGASAFTFLCEKKGKIVADMHVLVGPEEILLVVARDVRDKVAETLEHHLIMEDVEIARDGRTVFRVYGPKAAEVASGLGGGAWPKAPARVPVAHVVGLEDVDTFAERVAEVLRETGAAMVDPLLEAELRVALGVPRFGLDFGPTDYPQETGLHSSGVSFSKGCYLGQEVLYMLEHRGHAKRSLVRLEGEGELARGDKVTDAGVEVGEVTSVARHGGRVLALASIKASAFGEGKGLAAGSAEVRAHALYET
jgi:folate-binding protein YgfZ